MEGALVDKKILKERLELISEVRAKIEKMKISSAFVTDFNAMRLLAHLLEGYQELMSENIKLQKLIRVQEVANKLSKKKTSSKKKDS